MSLSSLDERGDADGFPRASGDEPLSRALIPTASVFSPRERG